MTSCTASSDPPNSNPSNGPRILTRRPSQLRSLFNFSWENDSSAETLYLEFNSIFQNATLGFTDDHFELLTATALKFFEALTVDVPIPPLIMDFICGLKPYLKNMRHKGSCNTFLHHLCRLHLEDEARRFLSRGDVKVDSRNSNLDTPLIVVAKHGQSLDMVRLLLDHNANANAMDGLPLAVSHYALQEENIPLLVLLSQHTRPIASTTPLHVSALEGCLAGVEAILNAGFNVNQVDGVGDSALMVACRNDHWRIVELLLNRGASTQLVNLAKESALILSRGKMFWSKVSKESFELLVHASERSDETEIARLMELGVDLTLPEDVFELLTAFATAISSACGLELLATIIFGDTKCCLVAHAKMHGWPSLLEHLLVKVWQEHLRGQLCLTYLPTVKKRLSPLGKYSDVLAAAGSFTLLTTMHALTYIAPFLPSF